MTSDEKVLALALLEVMKHGTAQSKNSYKHNAQPLTRHEQRSMFLTPHEAWACAVLLAAEAGFGPDLADSAAPPPGDLPSSTRIVDLRGCGG